MEHNSDAGEKNFKFFITRVLPLGCLGLVLAVFIPWQSVIKDLLPNWAPQHELAVHRITDILMKVGEALVIAAVLAVIVDEAAKQKLLKEFGENISLHIMGRFLPRELRAHIGQYLKATFVRRNWVIIYTIKPRTGKPDYPDCIELKTRSEYEILNYSEGEAEYTFKYELEDSLYSGTAKIDRAAIWNHATGKWDDYPPAKLVEKTKRVNSKQVLFEDKVKIPVFSSDSADSKYRYKFLTESTECFSTMYTENFTARYPVLNMTTFTVFYPEDTLEVDVYLSFDSGPEALTDDPIEGGRRWYINKPILPGQCFFATWKKKSVNQDGSAKTSQLSAATPG